MDEIQIHFSKMNVFLIFLLVLSGLDFFCFHLLTFENTQGQPKYNEHNGLRSKCTTNMKNSLFFFA